MNNYYKYTVLSILIVLFGFFSVKYINTFLTFNNSFELNDSKAHLQYEDLNKNVICENMKHLKNIKLKFEFERMFVHFNGRIDIEDTYGSKEGNLLYSGPFKKEIILSKCIDDSTENNDQLRLSFSFYKNNEVYFSHTQNKIKYDKHKSIKIILNSVGVPSVPCNVEFE